MSGSKKTTPTSNCGKYMSSHQHTLHLSSCCYRFLNVFFFGGHIAFQCFVSLSLSGGAIELQCFVHIFDKISCNTKVVFNHFDRDSHEYRQSLYIACKTQQKWGCTSSRNSSTLGISQSFSANPIAVPSIHGYSTDRKSVV